MSFYSWAFNDLDDPYWACIYNVDTHPLYHQCDKCPSFLRCTQTTKIFSFGNLPADCPQDFLPSDCVGNCLKCQKYTQCPYLNNKPIEPPPKPPPLPYQDVTGDQLFDMLLQRIKQFFTRSPPKNNPIPSKWRRE